jgi:hypothetical protein
MSESVEKDLVESAPSVDNALFHKLPWKSGRLRTAAWIAGSFLGLWALVLCWTGVSWAFHAWPMLAQDEVCNLGWAVQMPYRQILHLFPEIIYNDRPIGFALERFLFDRFGFNYFAQLVCFLVFHFANCAMAFLLVRRLGLRLPLAIAALGVFGALSTTAQTATYLGASFDVLCTFFLLGSTLAILSERRWSWILSACLFLLALRSKEFAIVIPVFLTVLLAIRAGRGIPLRRMALEIGKRLWPHYAILLVFGIRYLWLAKDMRAKLPAGTPYYLDFSLLTALKSLGYYAALIFGAEDHFTVLVCVVMLAILTYAVVRRRAMILAGFGIYALTLLPVSFLANIRSPFYAYGPQIFLLLAIALFLQDLLDLAARTDSTRWWAGICIALAALTAVSAFRESQYYRDRVHWSWMIHGVCGNSAASMQRQIANMGPYAHLYVNSGRETPWLFEYGDCVYPRMLHRSQFIQCIIKKPESELKALYALDSSEKYFADYAPDGTLTVRSPGPASGARPFRSKACEPGLIDDQDPRLRYKGQWVPLRQFGQACGGTLSYTDAPGAEVTLPFHGTSVTYVFTRAYTRGLAEVLIDGTRREVIDEYAPGVEWHSEATYDGLAPGPHTITIRVLHTKAANSRAFDVDLDGFLVR